MGPRASLNTVAKTKNPFLCQELNPGCPAHSLVSILSELTHFTKGPNKYKKYKC